MSDRIVSGDYTYYEYSEYSMYAYSYAISVHPLISCNII